jgi:hypothetical protein
MRQLSAELTRTHINVGHMRQYCAVRVYKGCPTIAQRLQWRQERAKAGKREQSPKHISEGRQASPHVTILGLAPKKSTANVSGVSDKCVAVMQARLPGREMPLE